MTDVNRTRIKFCGITCVPDALLAADCGADAVGMVLHPPARRNVSVDTAIGIASSLPPFVTPVGLFVDQSADHMMRIADRIGLYTIQLHGHESAETVRALAPRRVVKAVRVDDQIESTLSIWRRERPDNLCAILLESPGSTGGTGIVNDWARVVAFQQAGVFAGLPRVIAAGGLRPGNVAAVVRAIRPWAVDVSSGIEETPGRKSLSLMLQFADQIRAATEGKSV